MKIIAVGHYKRTGKDTFANAVIAECYKIDPMLRVGKRPWAWKLKQICHELYAWAGLREPEFYDTPEGEELREVILKPLGKSPRQIWIDFGTAAVREKVYEDTWLDYNMKSDHGLDVMIVPDTRFFNEIRAVEAAGGHTLKIVRPGFGPGTNKPDRELWGYRGWTNIIGRSGDKAEIIGWAQGYAAWLTGSIREPFATDEQKELALAVERIEPWLLERQAA